MAINEGNLAALIGSRLCHDLVSPLGAIGNGLELMQMMQAPTPEMDLVDAAVKVAQTRLRLFRLAFGVATEDQTVDAIELTEALKSLGANGRITVKTDFTATLARTNARRLALAALCVETALAWGGDIDVTTSGVSASAARFKFDPALWATLSQGDTMANPVSATVHFAILAATGPVAVHATDTGLWLTV